MTPIDNRVIRKGSIYIDPAQVSMSFHPGVVSKESYLDIRKDFNRADHDINRCDSPTLWPVHFYTSIREVNHTNLVLYERILTSETQTGTLYCPEGFLFDGSTCIQSGESDSFEDLCYLSCFETLNTAVDKDLMTVTDIRRDIIPHSWPVPIGACYLEDIFYVVTSLAVDVVQFARLVTSCNNKYDVAPLDTLINMTHERSNKGVCRVFSSMNIISGRENENE